MYVFFRDQKLTPDQQIRFSRRFGALERRPIVASFSSFDGEIDITALNKKLAKEGRLALPRVEGELLVFYQVTNLESDLQPSKWGVNEPIPTRCKALLQFDAMKIQVW